jgi:hypothetical protein
MSTQPALPGDETFSLRELLRLCLWDLYAGCQAVEQRLPAVARHAADASWRAEVQDLPAAARLRAQRMHAAAAGGCDDGPDNLWMDGIMDDAERDTRTIAAGRLLDIAMIGAVHKAIAAERASILTAKAISAQLGESAALQALTLNEGELRGQEVTLDQRLQALTSTI